jgi:hypothetical protein
MYIPNLIYISYSKKIKINLSGMEKGRNDNTIDKTAVE